MVIPIGMSPDRGNEAGRIDGDELECKGCVDEYDEEIRRWAADRTIREPWTHGSATRVKI